MQFHLLQILAASAALALVVQVPRQANALDVVKTVVLKDGQVLDWVRRESQDANFGSSLDQESNDEVNILLEKFATPIPEHLRGPKGTVPIPRWNVTRLPPKKLPPFALKDKVKPVSRFLAAAQDYTGQHWYASTSNPTKITGGGGGISMFKPYLESWQDFSLIQTAMVRTSAKTKDWGDITQTIEAGWMYYPPRGENPMFFTFFSANGYQGVGDYLCGWNTEQKGWVQVHSSIYPGMMFDKFSVIGGQQLDFDVRFHLNDGKWWLKAFGQDIGYYPAELFSKNSQLTDTLAAFGDRIDFYGEVYNSGPTLTTTDMGSGEFPEAGDGKVGYVKNMVYLDSNGREQKFSGYTQNSDTSRYRIKPFFNSGTSWASYVYLGGPGANGVVGG